MFVGLFVVCLLVVVSPLIHFCSLFLYVDYISDCALSLDALLRSQSNFTAAAGCC